MKKIVKCCLAVALGFTVAGCSKGSSGGSGGGGSGKLYEHKGVQLWKDGPYWAETNIGAENPWDYGYYFWWGGTIGYKRVNDAWVASDGSSRNFSFDDGNTPTHDKNIDKLKSEGWITKDGVLAPEHDAAHMHWGGNWRMPTQQELNDLCEKCDWECKVLNGVKGYVVRGRGDYASANIFLPRAGCGDETLHKFAGSAGCYWSSIPLSGDDEGDGAWGLSFDSNAQYMNDDDCCSFGQSVRPVQGFTK